jgi:hypothetical protein
MFAIMAILFLSFQAQQNMYESSQKLDLIRHSLELHRQKLPPESSVATDVKFEIDATQSMSPGNMTFTNLVRTLHLTHRYLSRDVEP